MRFLTNVRNDSILCGFWGSSGDLFSKSPLLPHHTKPIDVVIPNESGVVGGVRNLQKKKLNQGNKTQFIFNSTNS
jgi:hypothetical protein